jgi:hypothetical protein
MSCVQTTHFEDLPQHTAFEILKAAGASLLSWRPFATWITSSATKPEQLQWLSSRMGVHKALRKASTGPFTRGDIQPLVVGELSDQQCTCLCCMWHGYSIDGYSHMPHVHGMATTVLPCLHNPQEQVMALFEAQLLVPCALDTVKSQLVGGV